MVVYLVLARERHVRGVYATRALAEAVREAFSDEGVERHPVQTAIDTDPVELPAEQAAIVPEAP